MEPPDPLVVVAAAVVGGAIAIVAPAAVAAVALTVLAACVVTKTRPGATLIAVACVLACVAGVRAARALALDADLRERVGRALPRTARCVIEGEVVSMPVKRGVLRAEVRAHALECEAGPVDLPPVDVRIYELPDRIARGDVVAVVGQIAPARRVHQPELGDPRPAWARRGFVLSGSAFTVEVLARGRGPLAYLDRARADLRRGIERAMPSDVAPIARAIVLGEEDLVEADDEAFRRSGLVHLLAVSGSHVALVVGGLVSAIRAVVLRVPRIARPIEPGRVGAALGIPLAIVYEQLAGDSGSARRATAMAVLVLAVRACGRRPDATRTIAASVLVGLAIDPLAPFDLSFALSICATAGLVGLGPPIASLLERLRVLPRMVRAALATTLAASAACAPLIASIAGALPLAGLLANVVAVPIGELAALPLCNAAALASAVAPRWADFVVRAVADAASASLILMRGVARIAATPSFAVVTVPPPTRAQLAIVAAAILVAWVRRRGRLEIACVAVAAYLLAELAHVRASRPRSQLRVTVLDVGQGDSILVDFPDGRAMLVDGGGEVGSPWDPGRVVVAPVLAARRRARIDVAVLSHPHPDHFLGLRHPLSTLEVGAVWDTGESEAHGEGSELGALLASLRARRVPVLRPKDLCARPRDFGGATVEVLHPCPAFDPDRHANDNSFVLRVTYGERTALLVGDAEHAAEEQLVRERAADLRADFLKVGHHGSRTSSTAPFLAAVSPSVAAISCGVRNRFGHPHREALARLGAAGARVLRTDLHGSIRWTTDGVHVEVATAREGW